MPNKPPWQRIGLAPPVDLLSRLDEQCTLRGLSRPRLCEEALRHYLGLLEAQGDPFSHVLPTAATDPNHALADKLERDVYGHTRTHPWPDSAEERQRRAADR